MNATAAQLVTTACQSLGYAPDSRKALVAELAMDVTLDRWPESFGESTGQWQSFKDFQKQQEREQKLLRRQVKRQVWQKVYADPQAYGFDPFTIIILGWIVSGVVSAIVRFLIEKWWSSPSAIQAARTGP